MTTLTPDARAKMRERYALRSDADAHIICALLDALDTAEANLTADDRIGIRARCANRTRLTLRTGEILALLNERAATQAKLAKATEALREARPFVVCETDEDYIEDHPFYDDWAARRTDAYGVLYRIDTALSEIEGAAK